MLLRGIVVGEDVDGILESKRPRFSGASARSSLDTNRASAEAVEKKKPGTLAKAFDTHPQNADRIQKSQDEIRKILPAKQQYVVTTSEFDEVKGRLAAIENKHKLLDEKDSSKPSLRRTSNTSDKSEDGKKDDDDRPTLKRRDDTN